MKQFLIPLLLFSLGLCAPPCRGEEFTVAVEAISYSPHYTTINGTYQGFARELLDRFATSYGHHFTYTPLPILRLYKQYLDDGKFDFKYPDNGYWQQGQKTGKEIIYSQPVVPYSDGVMVLPSRRGQSLKHLKHLGTIRGFTPWKYLDLAAAGTINIVENNSLEPLLKMTLAHRVDGAYVNRDVALYQLKKDGKEGALVFDATLPHTSDFYYLSTMKHPAIIKQFNTFLLTNKDFINQLKRKHGLPEDEN